MSSYLKKNIQLFKNLLNINSIELSKNLKIPLNTLRGYEFGEKFPSYENLQKISSFFGISIDFFLFNNDNLFVNFTDLFFLAEKANNLPNMERNHIDDSISQFIRGKSLNRENNVFDNVDKFKFENSIHSNISTIRSVENLTLESFAKLIGVAGKAVVWKYEKKSRPSFEMLKKISRKFRISLHYLITSTPLVFNIKDSFLLNNLIVFDKTCTIEDMLTVKRIMGKVLQNNNIPIT